MNKISKYSFSDLYDMASGISSKKEQAGHGAPFVSFGTVFNNYFLPDELPDLMNTSKKEQEIYSIKEDDILITRTSETIDELAMSCVAIKDYPKATYSGFTKRLRPKTKGIAYSKYMAFYLRGYLFRRAVTNNAFMTLRASFNEDIFSFLKLYLPEYKQQVAIGDLLYKIEQKIQLNNKINDNLVHKLQLYFDYWFNQFEFPDIDGNPYRQSGGLMNADSKSNRIIPPGWRIDVLSEIADIVMGQSPSGDSYNESAYGMVFYQGSTDFGDIYPTTRLYTTQPCRMANINDTLLSVRAPAGTINIAFEKCCIGRGLSAICGKNGNASFVRYLLKSNCWFFDNINNSGTTFGSITKDVLFEMPVIIPKSEIISKFEDIATLYEGIIHENERQNRELTALRDWLLPILMNGQATIED